MIQELDTTEPPKHVNSFDGLEQVYNYLKLLGIDVIYPTPQQLKNNTHKLASKTITIPLDDKFCYKIIPVNDDL